MGGITSLSIAGSGLWAAQAGLSVVGHNLANVNTIGYSRQSTIQADWKYLNVSGGQLGYGTSISSVRQIRNEFLDVKFRVEVTKATYYGTKVQAGQQIESLLGELQSEYTTESVINDLWNSLNELVTDPSSLETRGNFVSTAITLVDKMKVVYDGLIDYQNNLNQSVKDQVSDLNYYVSEIKKLNGMINSAEATGANANDYRDARNSAMDALSEIANVQYFYKKNGDIDISIEGRPLLSNGMQSNVGLRYTTSNCSYVEPVFTTSTKILKCTDAAFPVYNLTKSIDTTKGDDGGSLKATLVARGLCPVDYTTLDSLVPSTDFLKMGAPNPDDYPLGSLDPNYQTDVADFLADTTNTFLDRMRDALGFLPEAPIAPNPLDTAKYPGGTSDVSYQADLITYYNAIEEFNLTRTYKAPVLPDATDLATYPLGESDPQYIADAIQYALDITTYNAEMISLTAPTAPTAPDATDTATYPLGESDPAYIADLKQFNTDVAEYNLKAIQYQEDNAKYQNYLTKYQEYVKNDQSYDFNHDRMMFNCTESTIPVLMQNLDQLFHDMVTLINNSVAPLDHNSQTAPTGLDEDHTQFMEIFVRDNAAYSGRYDSNGLYLVEDGTKKGSLYSIGNTIVNTDLLNPSGYNQIAFSSYENPSDNTIVNNILEAWANPLVTLPEPPGTTYEALGINEAYNALVTLNATATAEDNSFLEAQIIMVNSIESSRLAIMGVSLDEEMANMQVYQNAYEASARIFSVIDEMLDKLINGTGRVGL